MGKHKKISAILSFLMAMCLITTNVSAKKIVNVKHDNTKEEIVEIVKRYPHSGLGGTKTSYNQTPVFDAPYYAGSLNPKDLDDAVNAVKVVRYLAGVPYENIKFTDELNNIAQHGAVLLAASNQFSHHPTRPADMSEAFFELASRGCSEANLFAGRDNLSEAVLGFIYDSGQGNISRAGHRRWVLKPGAENFGMGYADGPNASYSGHRISMHVFDGLGHWECESDSYIAWPSAGDFPIQYFAAGNYTDVVIDAPWSINLGSPYATPSKSEVVLKLTRKRDGKTWLFDKNTPDLGTGAYNDDSQLHLAVDDLGYGMTKAIVFRPDPASLGQIKDGDVFTVNLSGIKYTNGKSATLSYDIKFFDLSRALDNKIVLTIGQREATVFGRKEYSDVSPVLKGGRTMLPARFVAESLGADVAWSESEQKVTITYSGKKTELYIGSDTAYVNGKKVIIDAPAYIERSRTFVPVRFIAESFGADVAWNEAKQQVTISVK